MDLQKTYNFIHWDCLFDTFLAFGISRKFVRWIRACITFSINRSLEEYCPRRRRLWQVDPLSLSLLGLLWTCCLVCWILLHVHFDFITIMIKFVSLIFMFADDLMMIFNVGDYDSLSFMHQFWESFSCCLVLLLMMVRVWCFVLAQLLVRLRVFQRSWVSCWLFFFVCYLGLPFISRRLSYPYCLPLLERVATYVKS